MTIAAVFARWAAAARLEKPEGHGLVGRVAVAASLPRADTATPHPSGPQDYFRIDLVSHQDLEIELTSPEPGTVQIAVAGEIDIGTGGELRAAITAALRRRPEQLILDLAGVQFADSQLVHALEQVAGEAAAVADVRVVGARPQVARMLAVCGVDHLCDEAA